MLFKFGAILPDDPVGIHPIVHRRRYKNRGAAGDNEAGQQIIGFAWPKRLYSNTALPRYIRLYYGVANSFTAGTITAAIVLQRDDADDTAALYPSNFTVA